MVGIVEFHTGGRALGPAPHTGSNAMSDLSHRRARELQPRAAGLRAALLASAFTFAGAFAADAAEDETQIGVNAQTGVAVTIYNQDLALVKDRRTVPLAAGSNRLAFIDVSALIRPETALLNSSEGQLDVLEQNFDFDLLTPEKLLEKSVGGTVRLITTNPETGAETVEEATVLSVAGGVVLRVGDRIETAPVGRIVFSEVPANLRARPTLVVEIDNEAAPGDRPVELAYLTGGLSWSADYVAALSADEATIDLNGLVTLTNMSGTSYRDARLQLVAGDVNRVRQDMMFRADMMAAEAASPAPAMTEQALFEYHLYTLERPTTIADNQTKQVALLSGSDIPVTKEYRFVNIANAYDYIRAEAPRANADVHIAFDNTEAAKLGLPLPQGTVRVYKNDDDGQALFVGEDAIEHTPKNESVKLTLGKAFDVTARPKQTDFVRLSDRSFEAAYEIEIKNAKTEPVSVTVAETIPGEWKVLEESVTHEKTSAFQAEWQVDVPAEGSSTLTYRVRIEY